MEHSKPHMELLEGGGGPIEKITSVSIDLDMNALAEITRHFVDPADTRMWTEITFKPNVYLEFLKAWLAMGINDQYDVRCLIPVAETIRAHARTHGGASTVHAHDLSIYTAIQLLPICQDIPLNTQFSISLPMVEGDESRMVLSESIVPVKPLSVIPFNRRVALTELYPGESLSMLLNVGCAPNFSLRERTHWKPLPNGIGFGTQLGRKPMDYFKIIIQQLNQRLEQTENSRFDYMLNRSGLASERAGVLAYVKLASAALALA